MICLCFQCSGLGHYVVISWSSALHFCVKEPITKNQDPNWRVTRRKNRATIKMDLVKNVITMMVWQETIVFTNYSTTFFVQSLGLVFYFHGVRSILNCRFYILARCNLRALVFFLGCGFCFFYLCFLLVGGCYVLYTSWCCYFYLLIHLSYSSK